MICLSDRLRMMVLLALPWLSWDSLSLALHMRMCVRVLVVAPLCARTGILPLAALARV